MANRHVRWASGALARAAALAWVVGAACFADLAPGPVPDGPAEPHFAPAAGRLQSPVRLTLTPEGGVLVTDARQRMVGQLDPATLTLVGGAGIRGKPLALGFHAGRVYVGNATARTVDVLDAAGNPIASFVPGAVGYPSDISIDGARGLVFVLDGRARQVKVFGASGSMLGVIGTGGIGETELATPIGVAVDTARQEILVTDYGAPPAVAASVKIYSYDGAYLDGISGAGSCGMLGCSGGFSRPQGLTVGPLGEVFLADALLGRVLVYDRASKELVRTLGEPPTLHLPTDVAIAPNGDVFVVSNLTASVVAFRDEAVP